MQGRLENERKANKRILEKIQKAPTYMQDYVRTFSRKSYTTKDAYVRYVLEFLDYLKNEYKYDVNNIGVFTSVKASMINGYLDYLGTIEKISKNGKVIVNGDSIQARKFYAIKDFFKFLVNDEYIIKNPCDNVEPPKVDVEPNIIAMDKDEVHMFISNIENSVGSHRAKSRQSEWKSRDKAVMMLALSLGLRVTSLSEINLEDINFETRNITVTEKGNKTRTLIFSEKVNDVLLDWIKDRKDLLGDNTCDALFISNQRKRMCPKSINRLVEKYSQGIDKHITAHKLRSTCATNLYTTTGDIYLAADVLGHRNIQNTKRYAKIVDEKKEKAMKAMDSVIFG